ncbi:MAG: acyltransferase, partial [Succinivibrio sp.]|uniref:acyltransferase family protein n=1 Tax=Succinivibrio sp. TaxID=2053619 RepID=UPI002F92BFAF
MYHAFPTVLIGGFTGVDIFFVISGFLISSILFRELANPQNPGKINITDFYIRRIRRIFPALIAVLITCLTLGYFVLFPDEYALLGKHTAGGAVYINNILLYKESGNYFDVAANAKPLLHLWSLGVEEQFYLIFPLILWAIYRFNINFVFGLTVFTVISFICNKNAVNHLNQTAAFYLPQFRFWELSIGAILAYIVEYHKVFVDKFKQFTKETLIKKICLRDSNIVIKDSTLNNILSIIGLLLIIIGILTVKQNLKFPGTRVLIPVFGALFIIAAGKESFINKKILSNKIMVFLGLISYPLYLWHWPLLSFAYIYSGQTPAVLIRVIALGASLVLSIITFLLIEPPLRFGKLAKIKATLLLCMLCSCGGIGLYIQKNNGIEDRPSKYEGIYFNKDRFVSLIDSNNKEYFN